MLGSEGAFSRNVSRKFFAGHRPTFFWNVLGKFSVAPLTKIPYEKIFRDGTRRKGVVGCSDLGSLGSKDQ